MSPIGMVAVWSAVGVAGLLLALAGWYQPVPPLGRVVEELRRRAEPDRPAATDAGSRSRALTPLLAFVREHPRLAPSDGELRLIGQSPEQHVTWLALGSIAGMIAPSAGLAILRLSGLISPGWFVPVLAVVAGGLGGGVLVHVLTVERVGLARSDLRYQATAYLDVVTMLLAGNSGYEGALEEAASAGDGRLFVELRRRMREATTRGSSLTDALRRVGDELDLAEIEQIAATASLSASEGAPVARTLAAKCATMRAALAAESESEARLRTSRLTTPIVGMALIFMGLVIYPALSFS